MKRRIKTFDELVTEASSYLRQLSYSELSVFRFESVWKDIRLYMKKHSIMEYNGDVGTRYLLQRNGNVEYKLLCRREKRYIRAVSVLSDFQQSGSIVQKARQFLHHLYKNKKIEIDFKPVLSSLRFAKHNRLYFLSKRMLSVFLRYLNTRKIYSLKDLSNTVLFDFIKSLQAYSIESRKSQLRSAGLASQDRQ